MSAFLPPWRPGLAGRRGYRPWSAQQVAAAGGRKSARRSQPNGRRTRARRGVHSRECASARTRAIATPRGRSTGPRACRNRRSYQCRGTQIQASRGFGLSRPIRDRRRRTKNGFTIAGRSREEPAALTISLAGRARLDADGAASCSDDAIEIPSSTPMPPRDR
ncbi:hypothetical protein PUN28_002936 [Cardiocondyla obscurior]|uniref:Uncharacterized protein n=1 Tax=Cardiocondyla obscurior TaxID=286306 RepID=A0AAW2GWP0_9HYME